MRCPNCGYNSFDYLDQCVKCATDLTGARQRLNLPDIQPNPISFQEIMERMPIITQQERRLESQEATLKAKGPVLPQKLEIDLSQGLSLDISIPSDLVDAQRKQKSSALKGGGLELTLEGLDLNDNSEKRSK